MDEVLALKGYRKATKHRDKPVRNMGGGPLRLLLDSAAFRKQALPFR